MNHHYRDIRDRIDEKPKWWDENAVPRWCEFSPDETANIYADQVVLLRIECQDCGAPFLVAMSGAMLDRYGWIPVERSPYASDISLTARWGELPCGTLDRLVEADEIRYGDPPNAGCCAAGPTMNSVPRQVVEFWQRDRLDWERRPDLERPIVCDWADPEEAAPADGDTSAGA